MIDTVCLLIPKDEINFEEGVINWELYSKTEQYEKYVRNPQKAEKETGYYFPRITGYKRRFGSDANIRIEFSAPKIIYLNNLDELKDEDFPILINTLQNRLRTMGVILPKSVIENASVSSIHFSKNIPLKNGYTANYIISELNKIDLRKSFDFAKTRFVNNGQSLYAHTSAHQLAVYDKIADLNKSQKRSIDRDQTLYQKSLFTKISNLQEIIRIEIRLTRKQKLKKVLKDLGYKENPTFNEIFDSNISKKIVNDYWNKIIKERNIGLFSLSLSLKDILQIIFITNKNITPRRAIYLIGLYMLAKDEDGMRQFRSIVTKKMHNRSWYRMRDETRYVGELITKNNLKDWVKHIDNDLKNYQPYKVKQYENKKD